MNLIQLEEERERLEQERLRLEQERRRREQEEIQRVFLLVEELRSLIIKPNKTPAESSRILPASA